MAAGLGSSLPFVFSALSLCASAVPAVSLCPRTCVTCHSIPTRFAAPLSRCPTTGVSRIVTLQPVWYTLHRRGARHERTDEDQSPHSHPERGTHDLRSASSGRDARSGGVCEPDAGAAHGLLFELIGRWP